jgi:hypothetical protein
VVIKIMMPIVGWAPWCTLVLTSIFIAQMPWWGTLLIAGFGWNDFLKTASLWVAVMFGVVVTGGASWALFERTLVSALLVGIVAIPGLINIKKAGLLADA